MSTSVILGFEIEWFDNISSLMQIMYLKYFVDDNTIEILKEKSAFLKRIYYPEIKLSDLFLGNTITIHNRLYTIKNYANKFTTQYMQENEVRFLLVVPTIALKQLGRILASSKQHGLSIGHVYSSSEHISSYDIQIYPGDTIVEVVGIGAHIDPRVFVSDLARVSDKTLARPVTVEELQVVLKAGTGMRLTVPSTLCLIKPHIVRSGLVGEVIQTILDNGFNIAALFSIHLTVPMTEELFEAYRGVLPDYSTLIQSMTSGACIAIAVTSLKPSLDEDIVSKFRDFVGPINPALAKVLRPESLRARFGSSMLNNAIHCTDLPEDGDMECRYFFETLANL